MTSTIASITRGERRADEPIPTLAPHEPIGEPIGETTPKTIEIKVRKITERSGQGDIATIVEYPMTVRVGDDGQPILSDLPADVRPARDQMFIGWRLVPTLAASASEALVALRAAAESGTPFPLVVTECHRCPGRMALRWRTRSRAIRPSGARPW